MESKFTSNYDKTRETVGKIYRDLHLNIPDDRIEVGDMTNAMLPGLVHDINEGIALKPFGDKPWYIMIHEKKDLQMKEAFLRRVLHFEKRPWPEDDTTVFYHDPNRCETLFCWSLPHWSEMDNMLTCYNLYEPEMIKEIKAWKAFDLYYFGFIKDEMGDWQPNPNWKDKALESPKIKIRAA